MQLNKLADGAARAIRSPVSETRVRGSPVQTPRGSSSEPLVQGGVSPKGMQLRRQGKSQNEGVLLIGFDSPDPVRDGASRETKQPPPGPKGQDMGKWQAHNGTPPPVVQKPRNEGVLLLDANFPGLKPTTPKPPVYHGTPHENKQPSPLPKPPAYYGGRSPPPLKPARERDVGQGQGHRGTLPVVQKPDNEGVLIDVNSPGPHHPAQDSISHESKHTPPPPPPPPRPPKEREEQEHRTPPAVRKPDVEDIPRTNPDLADPRPPVQGGAQHEGNQTPGSSKGQCAAREQGAPTVTRTHENESGAPNFEPVDPQLQARDSASRKDRQPSVPIRGRGGGRLRGGGGRVEKGRADRGRENEGGALVDTDPPDPQSPVPDGALRDNKHPPGRGVRSSTRVGRGRTTSNRERAVDREQENELVRRDSLDTTVPKDSKSKGDSSQPKDGVILKRNTMV